MTVLNDFLEPFFYFLTKNLDEEVLDDAYALIVVNSDRHKSLTYTSNDLSELVLKMFTIINFDPDIETLSNRIFIHSSIRNEYFKIFNQLYLNYKSRLN